MDSYHSDYLIAALFVIAACILRDKDSKSVDINGL